MRRDRHLAEIERPGDRVARNLAEIIGERRGGDDLAEVERNSGRQLRRDRVA